MGRTDAAAASTAGPVQHRSRHPVPSTGSSTSMSSSTIPHGADQRRGPLRPGERVQLSNREARMTTIAPPPGGAFHTHRGYLPHDELIGVEEGSVVTNTIGHR